MTNHRLGTRLVHAGEPRRKPAHTVTMPIAQSSTFVFDSTQDLIDYMDAKLWGDDTGRSEYSRIGNPTVAAVEAKLADLDSGEAACLFSSGMAAVTTTLMSLLDAGSHMIIPADGYAHTHQFVTQFLTRFGVEVSNVPFGDYDALVAAIQPNTRLIYSESPTNPTLRVVDLEKLVAIAKDHKVKTVIDSTFASPINQRPLEFGVDVVIHSATKYLGGHNDLLAGVVVCSDYLMTPIKQAQILLGGVCDPNTAYLLLRGLKTLELRVQRQNDTAQRLAECLAQHPAIRRVYYPGLPGHPDYDIAAQQMSGGSGVVSFEVEADLMQTGQFVDKLAIPYIGPSLGGVESLVEQVAIVNYYELSTEERADIGISDSLVRYAVGVEAAEDLIADVEQALAAVFAPMPVA